MTDSAPKPINPRVKTLIEEANSPQTNRLLEFNSNIREAIKRVGGTELLGLFDNFFEREDMDHYHTSIQHPELLKEDTRLVIEAKKAYMDYLREIAQQNFLSTLLQKMHAKLVKDHSNSGNIGLNRQSLLNYYLHALIELFKITIAKGETRKDILTSAKEEASRIVQSVDNQLKNADPKDFITQIPILIKAKLSGAIENTIVEKVLDQLTKIEKERAGK